MKWNWQQNNWPNFSYENSSKEASDNEFIKRSGIFMGGFQHLNTNDQNQFKVDLISNEALKTSEIEGEYLNRDSIQSSVRRHFGLDSGNKNIPAAEQGIADMIMDLYESFDQPLTHKTLYTWHNMLCAGRNDINDIGKYRTHNEPMQVISGPLHKLNIHFEAPPSSSMKKEMDSFITWFNDSKECLSPLIRASIAHLYFVCIHPFEDGNGRIGRAITEKALAQSLGYPTLISLSSTIEEHKKSYYDALEKSNKHNEISMWIDYFSQTILDAQTHTQKSIEFIINKTKFFDAFRGQLNTRQEAVIIRMFKEGLEGFEGGLSANNYIRITKTSTATATRDLKDLIDKKAFIKTGELKHTRYFLNLYE